MLFHLFPLMSLSLPLTPPPVASHTLFHIAPPPISPPPSPISPSPKPSLRLSPAVAVVTVCSAHQAPAVPKQTVNSLITHLLIPVSFLTSVLHFCLLLPPLTGSLLVTPPLCDILFVSYYHFLLLLIILLFCHPFFPALRSYYV